MTGGQEGEIGLGPWYQPNLSLLSAVSASVSSSRDTQGLHIQLEEGVIIEMEDEEELGSREEGAVVQKDGSVLMGFYLEGGTRHYEHYQN